LRKEYRQFGPIGRGSAGEVSCCVYLAYELGYGKREEYERLYGEAEAIGKMLTALIRTLEQR
jgi:four helix bundle protein